MLLSYEKIFSLEVQPAVRSRAKQLKRLLYVLLFGWVPTVWKMKYTLSGMTFLWCNILRNIWQIPHSHYMQEFKFYIPFRTYQKFLFWKLRVTRHTRHYAKLLNELDFESWVKHSFFCLWNFYFVIKTELKKRVTPIGNFDCSVFSDESFKRKIYTV